MSGTDGTGDPSHRSKMSKVAKNRRCRRDAGKLSGEWGKPDGPGRKTTAVNIFVGAGNKTPPSLSRWMSGFCTKLICHVVQKPGNHRDELGGVVLSGLFE